MVLTLKPYDPVSKISDVAPGGDPSTPGGKGSVRLNVRILTRFGEVLIDFDGFQDLLTWTDTLSVEGASGSWTLRMRANACNEALLKRVHPGMVIECYACRNGDPLEGVIADPSKIRRVETSPDIPKPTVVSTTVSTGSHTGAPQLQQSNAKTQDDSVRLIVSECQRQGISDPNQIAYILATAQHESTFKPITEYDSGNYLEGRSDLGNTRPGDGPRYRGRGYVQLTGRINYERYSKLTGKDLVGNPDLALDPNVAAFVLVHGMRTGAFTGAKLSDYVGGGKADFYGARRIVNGSDRASLIASYAKDWQKKLPQYANGIAAGPVAPQPAASAPTIAVDNVIGPEVKPVDDPYLDKCPHLLMRGIITDYGRSLDGNATVLTITGESYGCIYKGNYVLTDLKSPDTQSQAMEVRLTTAQQFLGVSLIYYNLLKNWVESFWGQSTGWEARTRQIPFPPNYLTRANNEGSVWSNLQYLAIPGFFHLFCDHTGSLCWEKLPWSSRSQSLIAGRCWEDLQIYDLPSWKIISWDDRLTGQGIANFVRCIPTMQGVSNGPADFTSLIYNLGSIRQYNGVSKKEIQFPIGQAGDQYYTSAPLREQIATGNSFIDLCALEAIRWFDRPTQRVRVSVRGESAWRIHTRIKLTEDWHCANAKAGEYYVVARTHQINVSQASWTTSLDLVRDRRTRYLGIGVGDVPVVLDSKEFTQQALKVNQFIKAQRLELASQKLATGGNFESPNLSGKIGVNGQPVQTEQTTANQPAFGTTQLPPIARAENIPSSKQFTEAKNFKAGNQSLKQYAAPNESGNAAVEEVPAIQFVLAADEYWFYDRFQAKVIPIGNDPIAWARAKVIPRLGEQVQPVTITPQTAPTGIVAPTGGTNQPFTPVDRIYTSRLFDESPYPGCWDFTLSRGGKGFFGGDQVLTPIPSPISGKCTFAGRKGGYGNAVQITGSDGTDWFMGHMQSVAVSVGQNVVRGQTIGIQGYTGHVIPPDENGTHIHCEIHRGTGAPSQTILPRSASAPLIREYFRFLFAGKSPTLNGSSP